MVCARVCGYGSWGVVGVHAFGGSSWMWLAPTCMAVTIECVWCLRMWPWQLDVIGSHEFGGDSWMWFATHVCGAMADGRGYCPRVWRWQLEVIGFHVFGAASGMSLVPACAPVALGCDWVPTYLAGIDGCGSSWRWLVPTCVAVAAGSGWCPPVCWWQLEFVVPRCDWQLGVVGAQVCVHSNWM